MQRAGVRVKPSDLRPVFRTCISVDLGALSFDPKDRFKTRANWVMRWRGNYGETAGFRFQTGRAAPISATQLATEATRRETNADLSAKTLACTI